MHHKKLGVIITCITLLGTIPPGTLAIIDIPHGLPPKEFFINPDGTPATKIVVGETAAAADVVSAANIAAKIGNYAVVEQEVEVGIANVVGAKARIGYDLAASDSFLVYHRESGEKFYQPMTGELAETQAYHCMDPDYWPAAWIKGSGDNTRCEYLLKWITQNRMAVRDEDGGLFVPGTYNRDPAIDWFGTGWDIPLLAATKPPVEFVWVHGELEGNPAEPDDWEFEIPKGRRPRFAPSTPMEEHPYILDAWEDIEGIVYAIDFTNEGDEIYGVDEGDEVRMLGSNYIVVSLDYEDDEIYVAKAAFGYAWVKTGEEVQVGGYTIRVIDVNLYEMKAVVQIFKEGVLVVEDIIGYNVDPDEPEKNVILDYNDGEVIVKFGTAIVGAEGIVETKIIVGTDAYKLKDDRTFPGDPDWRVFLYWQWDEDVDEWVVDWIVFVNDDEFDNTTRIKGPADAFKLEYEYDEWSDELRSYERGEIVFKMDVTEEIELKSGEEFSLPLEGTTSADIVIKALDIAGLTITVREEEYTVTPEEPARIWMGVAAEVPVDLAKTDVEVTDEDKSNFNLVLVGGPAVNTLVRELQDLGKSTVAYADLGPGNGALEWIEDAFVEGKDVLIVAGADRAGTRAAAEELLANLAEIMGR
ncbi:MAG: hypothetical protein DRO11_04455 [Methanobacteriota archaeon]|nr:MAG: hypothetical protein DRO11_04455 [Euryarchaeota archaeon]